MSYPKNSNTRGAERLNVPPAPRPATGYDDPLAAPAGARTTNDHYDARKVGPADKPRGQGDGRIPIPQGHGQLSATAAPTPRNVTSPGKLRRVNP